jgi:hypothetical protein
MRQQRMQTNGGSGRRTADEGGPTKRAADGTMHAIGEDAQRERRREMHMRAHIYDSGVVERECIREGGRDRGDSTVQSADRRDGRIEPRQTMCARGSRRAGGQ